MDRIIITGSSGFIGQHTAGFFSEKGYHVTAQYRRQDPPLSLKILESDRFCLVRTDFTNPEIIDELVSRTDGIIHIAGYPKDVGRYRQFVESNVLATTRLLDSALRHRIKIFIFISSAAVHGFRNHIGSTEEGPYYKPVSYYQSTKKAAEDYVMQNTDKGVHVSVIRPANVYGPGDTTVMYKYFDQIMNGFLPLVSKGKSLTAPVYISDLVDSIYLAYTKKASSGQIYNISSGEKTTWKEIMDIAVKRLNPSARTISAPYWLARAAAGFSTFIGKIFGLDYTSVLTRYKVDQGGRNFSFSIEKARRELGYSPKVMIDEGMNRTCDAYLASAGDKSE